MAQNILFVNSSARGDHSESKQLAEAILKRITDGSPDAKVTRLDVATDLPPAVDMNWIMGAYTPPESHDEGARAAMAKSDEYVNQLLAADTLVLAVPMYNFNVPASFKLWLDQIVRIGRTFSPSYEGLAKGKKAYIASARGGGGYGSGQQMESIDYLTPYLRFILGFVGITDVTILDIENTISANENYQATKGRAFENVEAIVVEA